METEGKDQNHVSMNAVSHAISAIIPGMLEEDKYSCQNSSENCFTSVQGCTYTKRQMESVVDKHHMNSEKEPGKLESFPGSNATYRILEVLHCKLLACNLQFEAIA